MDPSSQTRIFSISGNWGEIIKWISVCAWGLPYLCRPPANADPGSFPEKQITMLNKRTKIKELLNAVPQDQTVTVMGWVRHFRNNQFIALNDGSTNNNLQIVVELGKYDDEFLKRITSSASLKVMGRL